MAVSVYKTFSAGEILSAADLNASLTQFTNNGTDVAFPLTKAVSAGDFAVTALGNATTDTGAANLRNIAILNKSVCDFRLTLTSATPVTTSDVTAAETVYWAPYTGNCVGLYDGTRWHIRTTAELSIDIPDATNCYDVFVYDNAGTATLELTAWTNETTRATALTTQDGILVKTGATTRRYVGTFYCTTAGNGQTEDSVANRYLWNYYNRVTRRMYATDATASWTENSGSWRQANGAATNQLNFVVGVAEEPVSAHVACGVARDAASTNTMAVGIGVDSTSARSDDCIVAGVMTAVAAKTQNASASIVTVPAVGKHYLAWLEFSADATTTWTTRPGNIGRAGMHGEIRG